MMHGAMSVTEHILALSVMADVQQLSLPPTRLPQLEPPQVPQEACVERCQRKGTGSEWSRTE